MVSNSYFLDTNILIDIYVSRPPFSELSKNLLISLISNNQSIFTSTSCISTLIYLIQKSSTISEQKKVIQHISSFVNLIDANDDVLKRVGNSKFKDLEDSLLYHIASYHSIKYLITRNNKDFLQEGDTLVISPEVAISTFS